MILCISDSFGLPRPGTEYSATWIARLKAMRPDTDFVGLFRRKANTDQLSELDYGEYLTFYRPEQVILQLGICDCAPRYVRTTTLLYRVLNHLPAIAWKTVKLMLGRKPTRTDVAIDRYEANLEAYASRCRTNGVKRLIIVKIGIPSEPMVSANPGVVASAEAYNARIDAVARRHPEIVCTVAPLAIASPQNYLADGYHPSPEGHRLIADAIAEKIA